MWASNARYQATVGGKLRSLHWLESNSGSGGWLAAGADDSTVGINWIAAEPDAGGSYNVEEGGDCRLYKSGFNLKGHTGGVSEELCM